ncbi:MAG: class I SAM-dependent methyltransferase [Ferruginibacter sp.]
MKDFWNGRYGELEYIYGEEPNIFFAEQLHKIKPGKIILPCEGEGRNGVYAASQGWNVNAFDLSEAGKAKALQLANKKGVELNYIIEDANTVNYTENSVDAVAFIYAHFPPDTRKLIHQKAISWLKPGGRIIVEAFNPQQLQNNSGGPKDLSMLYTENIIKEDFGRLKIECVQMVRAELKEGKYHEGMSDIIRFVGIKI